MQTDRGYIQEKDYLPKPDEREIYKPKPVLVDDIWKLDWEECPELLAKSELAQKIAAINTEWLLIPEPFRNNYESLHYGSIRAKLEANDPQGAINYLLQLKELIPQTYQSLVDGIINKITEVFNIGE
jgi:hypothetical protein